MGVSHSHYLGGPAVWTPLDREKAEAFVDWRAEFCSDCGTRDRDFDPDQGGHPWAFVGTTHRCVGCELIAMEREQIPDSAKGIKVGLVPNPDVPEPVEADSGPLEVTHGG